jgi:hypothetical protein
MTSSRYKEHKFFTNFICMSTQEYLNFKRSLETTCTFTRDLKAREDNLYKICPFDCRYYEVDGIQYFHVTNETRRKICKFFSEIR